MSRLFNNQFSSQKDGAYPFFSRTGRSNNLNAFGRVNQYRSPSFYDPSSRLHTLTSLCNDIISTRDNYSSPLKYAQFVIMSVLDNMDVDLFQILPKYDREHEQLTHQLGCLIGHDSPTFKLIFLNEDLFEYFMENFTKHAELSNAGFGSASSSLYIWLLNGYLQRLLPTSDTVLASVQFSTWFTSQTPKRPLKKMLKTPFQLLRRDLLTVASDSFEDSLEFDQSNYARLFQFVELLMSSYANTSISPSPAQIVSLKTVVESYTKFLLTPTAEKELETFKSQLRANKQFSHVMYGYLKSMLSNNALNESFVYHFEIAITLLRPADSVFSNSEALSLFKHFSTSRFLGLLDVLLDRISNADIRTVMHLDLLQYYLVLLMNENFIRLLCDLKVSAINYLKPIQKRLTAMSNANSANTSSSSFYRLSNFMSEMLDSHEEKDIKTYLAIIDNRLQNIYVTYPPSDPSDRPVEDDSLIDLTSVTFGAINTTLARRPKTGMPDHYIDSWNSMYYLTPKGIEQVLSRQARFEFSQYGSKIYASRGKYRWENKWLAEKLNKIALGLAHHPFVHYLRRLCNNNPTIGVVLRPIMMPRSPPQNVPVYGRNIPRHPETINLRIFASYPIIFLILFLIIVFVSYLLNSF